MSQENVEIVRRAFEALNRERRGDARCRRWLEPPTIDVELVDLPTCPDAHVRRGHDGIAQVDRELLDGFALGEQLGAAASSSTPATVCSSSVRDQRGMGERAGIDCRAPGLPGLRRFATGRSCDVESYPRPGRSPRSRGAVGARRSRRLLSLRDTARAMSQENVEIVQASARGVQRDGDLDGST